MAPTSTIVLTLFQGSGCICLTHSCTISVGAATLKFARKEAFDMSSEERTDRIALEWLRLQDNAGLSPEQLYNKFDEARRKIKQHKASKKQKQSINY